MINLLKTLTKHGRYNMAGFGFIKQAAQKAGKKMYGYGQKAYAGAKRNPELVAGAGILGGAAAVGQTDRWKRGAMLGASDDDNPILRYGKNEWDKDSPFMTYQLYRQYMDIMPENFNIEERTQYEESIRSMLSNKPGTPEKYKGNIAKAWEDNYNKNWEEAAHTGISFQRMR